MNSKKYFIVLIYIAVFLLCFGILKFLDFKPGSDREASDWTTQAEETVLSTPSDAGEESKASEEESQAAGDQDMGAQPPNQGRRTHTKALTESAKETDEEELILEEETKPTVIIASDLHYLSPSMTDYGEAYEKFVKKDDGKVLAYSSQLIEAFLDEVIAANPSVLVLSGDLTLNGEEMNHLELAEKLSRVRNAGIQVLVIPGNHDINNPNASSFAGEERLPAASINAEEFYEIYKDYGYDAAVSRDENSLSYLYPLDDKNWLLMLDSCQYEPVNLVGGRIKDETLPWIERRLVEARAAGALVIPIAHHNLLKESGLYTTDCTLEKNKTFIGMLEWWRLPVYMSGHLHLQRIKKYKFEPGFPEEAYSITEIVSNALSIAPCQYGIMNWTDEGELEYTTKRVDVSAWAADQGIVDENLLDFNTYCDSFLIERVADQIADQMGSLPDYQIAEMSELYGRLNQSYCAGTPIDSKTVKESSAYRLWERNLPDSKMFREIQLIVRDTLKDNNSFEGEAVVEYPAS